MLSGPPTNDADSTAPVSPIVEPAETMLQDARAVERSRLQSQRHRRPPTAIPGYTALRCLGEGAYGSVWLAYENKTGKQVAIKFYLHRRGLDWTLLNREIEKLAVLYTSRYIVRLIDVGWGGDPPYFLMEYIENGSLETLLEKGPLVPHEAVRITKSVLHGLVHAHGCGILHCDLKPANVLLDADLEPRLCDFGQSRLSDQQDPALGTLFYMAPEQADLKAVPDARWDVYALGALLYHLLCGRPPYRTEENEQLIRSATSLEERLAAYRRIVHQNPMPNLHRKRKGIDRRLAEIVDHCLRVNPEKRFPNAQAVLDVLEQRDRQRSRRPLITLGVIGPALLLASLLPIARSAMSKAVETARTNQIQRALESDALSAKILARGLERELEIRKSALAEISKDVPLRSDLESAIASDWSDRTALKQTLDGWYQRVDEARRQQGRTSDVSWFLCDAQGTQRWRSLINPRTIDKNWAHRDYFHGQNRNYSPDDVPSDIAPLRKPHISVAYRGTSEEKYKVAVSVPVWSLTGDRVIGVLARTSELGNLLSEYEDRIHEQGTSGIERIIALADHRDGALLYHPWIRAAHLRSAPDRIDTFERLKLDQPLMADLSAFSAPDPAAGETAQDFRTAEYNDPVGQIDSVHFGDHWLAAFAPVLNTSWMAIVQESRSVAIQPVQKLQSSLNTYFWVGVIIFVGLMGSVWFFVGRAVSDHGLRFWSIRSPGRSAASLSTTTDV